MGIAAVVVALGLTMLACEQLGRGRSWPRVRGWRPRAWQASCGFGTVETRLADMLLGCDLAIPHSERQPS